MVEISDYELERGKPIPSENHGSIQLNVGFELKLRYRESFRFRSEVNVAIGERVIVPDVAIFPYEPINLSSDSIVSQQLPLTTIEILSQTQALSDLIAKANAYFQAGVKSCWIVLPEVSGIFVYSALGKYTFFHDGETLTDVATGIELPLAPLFE
nr:Uma2 family endonuclease [Hymenobacter negativus]